MTEVEDIKLGGIIQLNQVIGSYRATRNEQWCMMHGSLLELRLLSNITWNRAP